MKYTKGKWQKIYSHNVCIGVAIKTDINYYQMICNSILPDTDGDYAVQKPNIEADMTLISKAPEMHEALKDELLFLKELYPYQSITMKNDISIRIGRIKSLLKGIDNESRS